MNCKPGDLAVVVVSPRGHNLGRMVTCIRLATEQELDDYGFDKFSGPVWLTDVSLRTNWGRMLPLAPDCRLRPIRDPGEDATDETLLWLPAPKQSEPA